MTIQELENSALNIRRAALAMAYRCNGAAHLGGGLSLVDILAVLYGEVGNMADSGVLPHERDKFILSKGHGVLGFYAVLAEFGLIDRETLSTFQQNGTDLVAHPVMNDALGIEASSGSLGQGISFAVGLALKAKMRGYPYRVFSLCGNGECNEGSVWEAAMAAVNFQLDNFTLIIDNNHLQSDGTSAEVMNVSDRYAAMLEGLGFFVKSTDGHDVSSLREAFYSSPPAGKPKAIVANTVKGKGISFMEDDNDWHHNRLTDTRYAEAMQELGGHGDGD